MVPLSLQANKLLGELTVDSKGADTTDLVWKDDDPDQLEKIPADAVHRHVDSVLLQESTKGSKSHLNVCWDHHLINDPGYVDTYILFPSTIWGLGTGKLIDAGIASRHSVQIPTLITSAIDRGQAGMVGKGMNVWPHVEIHECEYIITWDKTLGIDAISQWLTFIPDYSMLWWNVSPALAAEEKATTSRKVASIDTTRLARKSRRCYMS